MDKDDAGLSLMNLWAQRPQYPSHWGEPPKMQTRDMRKLPGPFGYGSSTLANWIQMNMDKDSQNIKKPVTESRVPAHWGEPPRAQTKDLRTLPGGYGRGSSTLAKWISKNMEKDQYSTDKTILIALI